MDSQLPGRDYHIDNRYKNYNWIKHSIGNRQSLVNDQVHSVIEDSDGDLWFGTSNGISLYQSKTGQWHSFLSSFDHQLKDKTTYSLRYARYHPALFGQEDILREYTK